MIPALANHLWQSTLFAAVAALLALALRKNRGQVRHWIWLAASLKFLVPFSLFVEMGSRLQWRAALPGAAMQFTPVMEEFSHPFTRALGQGAGVAEASILPGLLAGVWVFGMAAVLLYWW